MHASSTSVLYSTSTTALDMRQQLCSSHIACCCTAAGPCQEQWCSHMACCSSQQLELACCESMHAVVEHSLQSRVLRQTRLEDKACPAPTYPTITWKHTYQYMITPTRIMTSMVTLSVSCFVICSVTILRLSLYHCCDSFYRIHQHTLCLCRCVVIPGFFLMS